ncbi:uncharacterized mitochondrial protein AtMg00810-like [Nicotiana sylvestris]|uniref:uncharacterized mitochondrial protein AtMg00810-like n=1 Tax=Nicotiana sylvestris TaxID=4096 RepID=UPI00388C9073
MKDLGELKYFLGIEFARSLQGILMHQRKYTLELVSELGFGAAKPATTPIEVNVKLTTQECDEHTSTINTLDDALLPDVTSYQRLLGKLLYLTVTRPDIAFSVQTLSQFMQKPKKSYMEVALRVVKYVKNHPGQGVLLSSQKKSVISAFCDADWAACPLTSKSVSGFFIKYGNLLISWKSKKQSTISRNSAESEYRSIATTVVELVWIFGLLKDIGVVFELPATIFIDSKAAIQGLIKTEYVGTKEQLADVLTKGLPRAQHEYLVSKLGLLNIFIPPSLRGIVETEGVT